MISSRFNKFLRKQQGVESMRGPGETGKKGARKKLPPGGAAAARARQFQQERGVTKENQGKGTGGRVASDGKNKEKRSKH
jgi:hypothetical protein